MMPNNLAKSAFKNPALVLAMAAICGFGMAGCNDNDDDFVSNSSPTPMVTGDLIALTEAGQVVSVNRSAPSALVSTQTVIGLKANDSLIGIDYRPADGKLYGVGIKGNIYTLDASTGIATFIVALSADTENDKDDNAAFTQITGNASLMSVDFNPAADRLRVISSEGLNLRINVDNGKTITDGMVSDVGTAMITSVAYTNSFAGTGSTRLFDIDVMQDRLYLQNANAGTLLTSAPLGVNAMGSSGFDIDGMNNMGYAALKVGSSLQLYSIDLAKIGTETAAAMKIGDLPATLMDLRGIALKPAMNSSTMLQGLSADNQLVSFALSTPTMTTSKSITGLLASETIVGIDYRLRTETDKSGVLYGLSSLGNLYMIDSSNGAATGRLALMADSTDSSEPFAGLFGTSFAVDFNPFADRLRVLSNTGQSLRINVDTGATTTDGSINGVANAMVSAAAYTNSFQRAEQGSTTLYDLDQTGNQLLLQNPPNDGTVSVVGTGLGITLGLSNGMDIAGGDNGLVLATNGAGLYRINLMTGVATELAAKVGGASTPALVDLAILLK